MFLELSRDEVGVLRKFVETRIGELHVEFRRTSTEGWQRELKGELELFERILHKLNECDCDVLA